MDKKDFIFDSDVPNDSIDIYQPPEVFIKKLHPQNENEFRIEISGKNIDNSVVNGLRRTILMSIPIYAFHRSNITIDTSRSRNMYNNDLLYNQIETLPIYDIPNYFDLENPKIYLPTDVMKKLFSKFIKEQYSEKESNEMDNSKKLFKIQLSIDVKNNTGSDKFVTTHDAIIKVDGEISDGYKKRKPISIIVLKPSEEISLHAEANLAISKMIGWYEATTNAIHEEITPMKYHLWYETLEQLDKNLIFTKACVILSKKLKYLKKFIKKEYEEKDVKETVEIQLYGEDHTLGNLLATILQKCKFINKAGYTKPHQLVDMVMIQYKLKSKSKIGPINVLIDCIDYLIKLYELIKDRFLSMK